MGKSHWLNRLADAVLGPPVEWIGARVEARLRRAAPELPEPPVWAGPVAAVGVVGAVVARLVRRESASERATTEPEATEERGTTSERDEGGQDDAEEIVEALETLDVDFPPAPSQEEVKAAYRERAVETHPDQGGDAERFIEVREAWERLPEREELSNGGQEEK
jgi:hypothetical protein